MPSRNKKLKTKIIYAILSSLAVLAFSLIPAAVFSSCGISSGQSQWSSDYVRSRGSQDPDAPGNPREPNAGNKNVDEPGENGGADGSGGENPDFTSPDFPVYEINPRFNDYLNINPDIVGNIIIPGTHIDFPVVYNGDNDYYLKRGIYGEETKYGAIFMDMTNHGAVLARNTVIHGHNFNEPDKGIFDYGMFADIEKYKSEEFFGANKTIIFNNLYSDMEWEVFSVYVTSEDDYYIMTNFDSENDYVDFAELIKSKSMFDSDYEPRAGDYMITLHTCSYEFRHAHTLVHARLVKKTDNISER
ncbi:MAG: class B sortase [Oscillospiraceae bacterium]|nr:class B sortase [Oscillospiraceae bacterium]